MKFGAVDYLDTPKGRVWFVRKASPELIRSLDLEEGMGLFASPHYPPIREKKTLERIAANPAADVILAISDRGSIVGFVVIAPPSPAERWSKLGDPRLIEAMAIEVSKSWRSMGIADKIMELCLADPFFDDKIVICTGYSWHWDLEGTGLGKREYRDMLLKYLEKAGFLYYPTDEPNVNLDPDNFFTARIGPRVDEDLKESFMGLLFREGAKPKAGIPRPIREVLSGTGAA